MQGTKTIFLSALLLMSCNLFSQSPGGVLKQTYWLKGGIAADTSRQGLLNFHPALIIDNRTTSMALPGTISSLGRSTIFTVYQHTMANEERPIWEITGDFGDLSLSTRQVISNTGKTNLLFKNNTEASKTVPGAQAGTETIIHTWVNYQGTLSPGENSGKSEASIRLGNSGPGSKVSNGYGLISEFILYEKILTESETTKVETYLALKYGITLQKNYLSGSGETVWNRKNDSLFSNNIAGIGRDDRSMLYQKQSTSSNLPGQLVIGIHSIAESNSLNTGRLNNSDYLIWGDNAKSLILENNESINSCEYILSEKKWLMKNSGKSSGKISTELKIDTKTLLPGYFPKENFYLIIDRTGSGDFAAANCEYITPVSVSSDGAASFTNTYWDTDGSGSDHFTFGFKPTISSGNQVNSKLLKTPGASDHISFQVYPNPVTDGNYKMALSLDKPSDVLIEIYDLQQHLLESRKGSGQASYLFTGFINAPPGSYFVRLITPAAEVYRIMILQ